ncbi:hypothetical protein L1987_77983 [Smallanthus sonchifolius]|uniref:Uncharacterized protein n=1 Tax=Smallanthus sonchifolius TaxID=185202 RepID=A0ACB8ZBW0_9ASTR|nr:hypothetical protein L1987_77983 [Smallanthus sonchifolius]
MLIKNCPHHGLQMWEMLNAFHEGLTYDDARDLNSISNGTFSINFKDVDWDYLEWMAVTSKRKAQSSRRARHSVVRAVDSPNSEANMLEKQVANMGIGGQQYEVCDQCGELGHNGATCTGNFEDVNYVQGGGRIYDMNSNKYQPGLRNHPNFHYGDASNQANPKFQGSSESSNSSNEDVMLGLLKSIQQDLQKKSQADDVRDKAFHVMTTQMGQFTTKIAELKKSSGKLPSDMVTNPSHHTSGKNNMKNSHMGKVSTLRSGKVYDNKVAPPPPFVDGMVEDIDEHYVSDDEPEPVTWVAFPKEPPFPKTSSTIDNGGVVPPRVPFPSSLMNAGKQVAVKKRGPQQEEIWELFKQLDLNARVSAILTDIIEGCNPHSEVESKEECFVCDSVEKELELDLEEEEKVAEALAEEVLLKVLQYYKVAIGWTIADLKGVRPSIVMHKIITDTDAKHSRDTQRRLNPNMREVVKKEVLKWLDVGIIYPISDSPWVSPTSIVPKKAGIQVIIGDDGEQLATRPVTGWRVCIDYRKLNAATSKDNFPLPFIDKIIEKLSGEDHLHMPLCRLRSLWMTSQFLAHRLRFIKGFSVITKPLYNLLLEDVPFEFDENCLNAFHVLKDQLVQALILQSPEWNLPFEVMCYASDYAVGAVLGQKVDKRPFVIYYASKTLSGAQLNYTTTEKELLAVVYALDKFRSYIWGNKVIVYSDHAVVRYLMAKKDAQSRLIGGFFYCKNLILKFETRRDVRTSWLTMCHRFKGKRRMSLLKLMSSSLMSV